MTQLRGPLTLTTLEAVDEASEATEPQAGIAVSHQFRFASEYLHHLLSMATDPSTDTLPEIDIIDRRLALSGAAPLGAPVRTVRVRTAVLGSDMTVEAGIGQVAEQPHWVPRCAGMGLPGGPRPAVQHLMRRRDIEPCLLVRSLHWIGLRPTRRPGRGTDPGR
ncbi:MAG: hypothetical protein ACK515_09715 [bacterium]|nr:hypothetical protein [Betaproteobacteria bacterium]